MNKYQLLQSLENGTIDAAEFGHREHLQAAWEMLDTYDFLDACDRYSRSIQRLASAAGAPDKFNLTITVGFLSIIAERMHSDKNRNFDRFIEANPDLKGPALHHWYSKERLDNELARHVFLMPDLENARHSA